MTRLYNSFLRRAVVFTALLLLGACGSNPVDSTQVTQRQSPQAVAKTVTGDGELPSGIVMWGGVILSSANLAAGTQLEVLSYPLDHRQLPQTHRRATGRFLIQHPDYLETVDYAEGRLITVLGKLEGLASGVVGNTEFPVVEISPETIYLWRKDGRDVAPAFSVGIGISL